MVAVREEWKQQEIAVPRCARDRSAFMEGVLYMPVVGTDSPQHSDIAHTGCHPVLPQYVNSVACV
jgi:hypothetical protein